MGTNRNHLAGRVREIRRYPVKSILGESLPKATIDYRGLVGDRLWAIRNSEGKFGSGKTTRRFQRIDGLFAFQARYDGTIPIVTMPNEVEYRGDDDAVNEELSKWLGVQVTLAREESISHFDEGPISIITTSSLRKLSEQFGKCVDPRRFRANILIDTDSTGFIEDDWVGAQIKVGPTVTLKVLATLERCVMVNNAQEDLKDDAHILHALAECHDARFGVWAKIETCGEIVIGDEVVLR